MFPLHKVRQWGLVQFSCEKCYRKSPSLITATFDTERCYVAIQRLHSQIQLIKMAKSKPNLRNKYLNTPVKSIPATCSTIPSISYMLRVNSSINRRHSHKAVVSVLQPVFREYIKLKQVKGRWQTPLQEMSAVENPL